MQSWQLTFQMNAVAMVLITLSLAAATIGLYRRIAKSLDPRRWRVLLGLRMLALLILLVLLFKPAVGFRSAVSRQSIPVVALDVSRSMDMRDLSEKSRLEVVKNLLAENADLLGGDPPVRVVSFADHLTAVPPDRISGLAVEGQSTDLPVVFKSLDSLVPLENVQAVIFLTDGANRSSDNPVARAARFDPPVYCLGVGTSGAQGQASKLGLEVLEPPIKLVTEAENPVALTVAWQAVPKGDYILSAVPAEKPATTVTVAVSSGKRQLEVRLKPSAVGKTTCTLTVKSSQGQGLTAGCEFHALALPEKIRVLLIEGQIRPEFKFLKQYLQSDPAVALAGFVQIRPGKFLVTSEVSGLPLKGLPATKANWEKFDLVILGDVSARTFSESQARWIKELVESGKGLLVVAGEDTGELAKTPIGEILPVRLAAKASYLNQPFLPRTALAGKTHPALKGLEAFFAPDHNTQDVRLDGLWRIGEPWPAASVLLEHPDSTLERVLPILASRPVGKGRTGILTSASTWRWALNSNPTLSKKIHPAFWGQWVRSLAAMDPAGKQNPALLINVEKNSVPAGEPINVRCDLFDTAARPVTSAAIAIDVLQGGRVVETLTPAVQADHYAVRFSPKTPGPYTLRARSTSTGAPLDDTINVTVRAIDPELAQVALNKKLLDELAAAGRTTKMQPPDNLGAILRELRRQYLDRAARQTDLTQRRAFDSRVPLMLVFLALLAAEWFLRYRWRLR